MASELINLSIPDLFCISNVDLFLLHHFCLLFCPRPLWCCFAVQLSLPCKFANPLFVVCLLFHIHLWCFGPVLSKWHFKTKSHYIKTCFWCEMFPFMHPSKIDSLSTFSCIILVSVNFNVSPRLNRLWASFIKMSHARAIWSTNLMLPISIIQIEEWPWCRRPAVWAKPNSYFVTHPSQNGKRLQTLLSRQSVLIAAQVRFLCPSSQKQNRLFQSQDFGLDGDWGVYLLLPPQTYYLFFSGRGGEADSHSLAPWLGGGGGGGWLACSVHVESKMFWK